MNELIKITEKEGQQLVSARELHEFLEINSNFTTWFNRMVDYGFNLGSDFIEVWHDSKNGNVTEKEIRSMNANQRSREGISKDYAITIDMAKEISMIQRSEKGKQARQYFIQCEKKLKEVVQTPKQLTALEQLDLQRQAILEVNDKVEALEKDMPLFKAECDELQDLVHKVGVRYLGGKKSKAYNDASLRGRVYADIQHQLKREFGVNKYAWIKHSQFNKAKEIISNYTLPIVLEDEIILANNQLEMEDM